MIHKKNYFVTTYWDIIKCIFIVVVPCGRWIVCLVCPSVEKCVASVSKCANEGHS
jgi:hypothetical protein